MAKALGREIWEFYDKHFPEGAYHDYDDEDFRFIANDNSCALDLDKKYDLKELGFIVADDESWEKSFSSMFLKWKKSLSHEVVAIEVPKEKVGEVLATLKKLGIKVVN